MRVWTCVSARPAPDRLAACHPPSFSFFPPSATILTCKCTYGVRQQKWWPSYELPWWAPADTPTSLGRKAGGGTIQPPPPPEAVAAAASSSSGSNSSNSSSSLADAVAEAVAAFLSRPELDDPLKLPALQSWLRGHVGKSMAGAAGAAVEAVEALPGGGGADDDAAAAAAGAAAAQSGDMAAAAVAELDRMRQRGDMDLDLMLPTMVVVSRMRGCRPRAAQPRFRAAGRQDVAVHETVLPQI